jgi:pullulanase/glycogen debranching enzyme
VIGPAAERLLAKLNEDEGAGDVARAFLTTLRRHPELVNGVGAEITSLLGESPKSRALALVLDGRREDDDDLYVMINAYREPLTFALQEAGPWRRVMDTSLPSPDDIAEPGHEVAVVGPAYRVASRSIAVLVRPRA